MFPSIVFPEPISLAGEVSWARAAYELGKRKPRAFNQYVRKVVPIVAAWQRYRLVDGELPHKDAGIDRLGLLGAVLHHELTVLVADDGRTQGVEVMPHALRERPPSRVSPIQCALTATFAVPPTSFRAQQVESSFIGRPLYLRSIELRGVFKPSPRKLEAFAKDIIANAKSKGVRLLEPEFAAALQREEPFAAGRSIRNLWAKFALPEWRRGGRPRKQ